MPAQPTECKKRTAAEVHAHPAGRLIIRAFACSFGLQVSLRESLQGGKGTAVPSSVKTLPRLTIVQYLLRVFLKTGQLGSFLDAFAARCIAMLRILVFAAIVQGASAACTGS